MTGIIIWIYNVDMKMFLFRMCLFLCFGISFISLASGGSQNAITEVISYSSHIDKVSPLYALVAFRRDNKHKPIMVIMHSFGSVNGNKFQQKSRGIYFANKGFFSVLPDMRGRGGSAGHRDDGGLEIMDIYDAVQYVIRGYPQEVDSDNINIVGFSGGGGNVFSMITKFPDLINVAGAFFGISDYGYWAKHNKDFRNLSLGGTESEKSDRYMARNSLLGVINNPLTEIHLFWDEKEWICPPYFNVEYAKRARQLGYKNVFCHESKVGDKYRYYHGRLSWPTFYHACDIIIPEAKKARKLIVAPKGKMVVLGYLYTKRFDIFWGEGNNVVTDVSYECSEGMARFEFKLRTSRPNVKGWLKLKFSGENDRDMSNIKVLEDNKLF